MSNKSITEDAVVMAEVRMGEQPYSHKSIITSIFLSLPIPSGSPLYAWLVKYPFSSSSLHLGRPFMCGWSKTPRILPFSFSLVTDSPPLWAAGQTILISFLFSPPPLLFFIPPCLLHRLLHLAQHTVAAKAASILVNRNTGLYSDII